MSSLFEMLFSKSDQAASCVAALAASSRLLAILVEAENCAKLASILEKNVHPFTSYLSMCYKTLHLIGNAAYERKRALAIFYTKTKYARKQ